MGIKKNLHEIYLEVTHFMRKVYPDFVTSKRPDRVQGVPVFIFHTIRPMVFKEQLEFLKENNYIPIGADDLYNYLTGKRTIPKKSVLLTIDDGRKSVWTYGFPLLKEYGFKATIFVIPGHTKERSSELGVGSDLSKDETRIDDKEILSWQEIEIMNDSGLIEFGSHTLYHHKIFTGPDIVDFFGPGYERMPYSYPAVPAGLERAVLEKDPSEFFGMPIYISDSLMAGKQRFIDDQEFRKECMSYYRERLKAQDSRFECKKALFRFSALYQRRNKLNHRFLTLEDAANEIYDNLYTSKKILEERLGRAVNHLCYPFGIWSHLSTEMAKKAGLLSAFCSYIPGRQINRYGDDPYKIVRLKDDYIFRLPGRGRKSLLEIFTSKMKRRIKGERVY